GRRTTRTSSTCWRACPTRRRSPWAVTARTRSAATVRCCASSSRPPAQAWCGRPGDDPVSCRPIPNGFTADTRRHSPRARASGSGELRVLECLRYGVLLPADRHFLVAGGYGTSPDEVQQAGRESAQDSEARIAIHLRQEQASFCPL